jgi:hypothetical protein
MSAASPPTETQVCEPSQNTDRHLWPQTTEVGAPEETVHVTADGGIGMKVRGYVIAMPIREWHALAYARSLESLSIKSAMAAATDPATIANRLVSIRMRFCDHDDADASTIQEAILALRRPSPEPAATHCCWDEDENGCWHTDCNNAFEFSHQLTEDDAIEFCMYCGKPMDIRPHEDRPPSPETKPEKRASPDDLCKHGYVACNECNHGGW